jgi:hypothetical protein
MFVFLHAFGEHTQKPNTQNHEEKQEETATANGEISLSVNSVNG